jgi:hypothetical protein
VIDKMNVHGLLLFCKEAVRQVHRGSITAILLVLGLWIPCASGQTASPWIGVLEVSNFLMERQILEIGQDPSATNGIDGVLGEEPLPPPPPSTVFEGRLILPDGEASRLDLRGFDEGTISYKIKWQAGSGGYPVTLTWDPSEFPLGTELSDGLGGVFLGPIDMATIGTAVVGEDLFFLQTLTIDVTSVELENTPPILGVFASSRVYSGQRSRTYMLDEQVVDNEDLDEQLIWQINPGAHVSGYVSDRRVLEIDYPEGWNGLDSLSVVVEDLGGLSAQAMIVVEVLPEVFVPEWEFGLSLDTTNGENIDLVSGQSLSATDGIDASFGEVELPPWPPTGVFDARIWNSFSSVDVRRDFRQSPTDSSEYSISVQFGSSGGDLLLNWDPNFVPPGRWSISSILGGLDINLRDVDAGLVFVPSTYPVRLDLKLEGSDLFDVTPPTMPTIKALWVDGGTTLRILWEPVTDTNFAFYDIVLIDNFGSTIRRYDQWNVPTLKSVSLSELEVTGVSPTDLASIVLVAWDTFGHRSVPVEVSSVPDTEDLPIPILGIQLVYPNPFNPRVFVEFVEPVGRYQLSVYDLRGRRVAVVAEEVGSGSRRKVVSWDGRDDMGTRASAGSYYLFLSGEGCRSTAAVVMIK